LLAAIAEGGSISERSEALAEAFATYESEKADRERARRYRIAKAIGMDKVAEETNPLGRSGTEPPEPLKEPALMPDNPATLA
jgi:hypothetical protein